MQQQVMFTACPKGRTANGLALSVLISPKLDPQTDPQLLSTFPDFLDWPSRVIEWRVIVGNAAPVTAQVTSAPPQSSLWTGLFSANTLVRRPVHPDYTKHMWLSYPVGNVVDFIHNLYQDIAANHPSDFPSVDVLQDSGLNDVAQYDLKGQDRRPTLRRLLIEKLRQTRAPAPAAPAPEEDFFQVWNFHRPGNLSTPPAPPTFDFHEAVSLCGEHFGLMRRLGLVVDLLVPGAFANGDTTVRIEPVWAPILANNHKDVLPVTNCVIGADIFLPRPSDPNEIVNGRLPLNGDRYRTVQVDPDGGALNLMMLGRNLIQSKLFSSEDTPTNESLPALRSGGISIARTGHAAQLVKQVDNGFQYNENLENNAPIVFSAEDLWYGTRFDIWDGASGEWRSLQQRRGSYEFTDLAQTEVIEEEGAMVEAPSERDEEGGDANGDKFFYLQESLMRWDGWSLAAPRPGRTVDQDNSVIDEPQSTSAGYPLRMRFQAVPGTLPKLRFGRTYRVRARTVDPAGNSVPFDDNATGATNRFIYRRYEPIPTPFVLLTAPRTEGESDAVVVLRSDYNEDPSPAAVARILAPPRCAQRTAEEHGMWDDLWQNNPAAAYAEITAREDQGFHTPGFGTPDPDNYDQPYFPQQPVPIPYLPDPMARGASLRFIAADKTEHDLFPSFEKGGAWPGSWPEAQPVRLIVREGNGAPTLSQAQDEAEVLYLLPKAETAQLRLSSFPAENDLGLSAIWDLLQQSGGTAAQLETWKQLALNGRHWMISPYRTLRLIHAVRRPLKPPSFNAGAWAASRQPGDTFARVNGLLNFSRKSTGRVDLRANWAEPVDLGKGNGATAADPLVDANMRQHEAWLEVPLAKVTQTGPDAEDMLPVTGRRHEFNDTKRRIVTYTARATSAFTEYFQEREKDVPVAANQVVVLPQKPIVAESELVRQSGEGPSFERGTDYSIDYVNGQLTWLGAAATVDIVYLPEPTARHSTEAAAAEQSVVLDIPSAARPQSPKVMYVIPTHRWQSQALSSTGEGGGLRVYLDRPWFDTGVGQLLGVVLDPQHNTPSTALAPYTTRWGFDPIQGPPAPPTRAPRPQDFPLAAAGGTGTGRVLSENGSQVNVVGHTVHFDTDRKLWYADIEVDAGQADWPFIRLALAAYQPNSVTNLHLSPVILADIVQLTPDRTATIQLQNAGKVSINIVGPGKIQTPSSQYVTQVTAHLEYRLEDVADDELAWEALGNGENRIVLQAQRDSASGLIAWTGEITIPTARAANEQQLRVAIEEWEILPVTEDAADHTVYLPGVHNQSGEGTPPTEGDPYRGQLPRSDRRLLYRDAIALG